MSMTIDATSTPGGPKTVAEALGQIVWVLSQSALHRRLTIADLETSVMPAILTEQFRIFRLGHTPALDGVDPEALQAFGLTRAGLENLPLGVALWASLDEAAELKLEEGRPLELGDWTSGDRLWLLELISPFATPENELSERMLLDMIQGPFQNRPFKLHRTDPNNGQRAVVTVVEHIV